MMYGWQPPPRPAWRPRLGVGADGYAPDDPDEPGISPEERERRRALRQQQENPLQWAARSIGQRAGEIGQHLRENPLMGAVEAVGAIPEAASWPVRYLGGVAGGVAQSGIQRYGWDPMGRAGQLDEEAHAEHNPLLSAPIRGTAEAFGTLGRTAADALTGNLPAKRDVGDQGVPVDYGPFGTNQLPETHNIFHPSEALQRYQAALPGPLQLIGDFAGGGPLGEVAKVTRAGPTIARAAGQVAQDLGVARTLEPLAASRAAGVAQYIADTAQTPTIRRGLPAAMGLEGAREGYGSEDDQTGRDTQARLLDAAKGGAYVGLTGLAATNVAGSVLESRARSAYLDRPIPANPPPGLPAESQAVYNNFVAANQMKQGDVGTVKVGGQEFHAAWLGGTMGDLIDTVREKLGSRTARLNTVTQAALASGADENLAKDVYAQARTMAGIPAHAEEFNRSVMEPIFREAGVKRSNMEDFSFYRLLRAAEEHLQPYTVDDGLPTKRTLEGKALVPEWNTVEKVQAERKRFVEALHDSGRMADADLVYDEHGGAFHRSWEQGSRELTASVHNLLLDKAADAGVLNADSVAVMKDRYQHYLPLENVDDAYAAIHQTKPPDRALSVTGSGVGHVASGTEHVASTLEMEVGRIGKLMGITERNRLMLGLDNLTTQAAMEEAAQTGVQDLNKTKWGQFWRAPVKYEPKGTPQGDVFSAPSADVPRGFGRVSFLQDGKLVERVTQQPFADALNGMNGEATNFFQRIAQRANEPFRLGVTALNIPFLWSHANRTGQTFAENVPRGQLLSASQEYHRALFEELTGGFDRWYTRYHDNPNVTGLPKLIGDATEKAFRGIEAEVLGPAGRLRKGFVEAGAAYGGGRGYLYNDPEGALDLVLGRPLLGRILHGPADLLHTMTRVADETPRLALWRATEGMNVSVPQRALASRDIGVDFQNSGTLIGALNSFLPLLNAREQGTLTSLKGFTDDPARFMFRAKALVGMPSILNYTRNRLLFGDLYDQFSVDDRDHNWLIGVGRSTDEDGTQHPIALRIPKSPMNQLLSSPLEHFLDAHYHTTAGTVQLDPHQRTPRSAQEMWLSRLGMLLPMEMRSGEMHELAGWAMGVAGMAPLGTLAGELYANKERFTDNPIVPEEQRILPTQYQYGKYTTTGAKATSAILAHLLPGQATLAPAKVDVIAQQMGGSLAGSVLRALDVPVRSLQQAGLIEPNAFEPQTVEDLGLARDVSPEITWKYLDAAAKQDNRPWFQGFVPRFFAAGQGGLTIAARAAQMGPHEREVWQATRDYDDSWQTARLEYARKLQELHGNAGTMTGEDLRKKEQDLNEWLRGQKDSLSDVYGKRGALTDPKKKDQFIASLPGYDARPFVGTLPKLPDGWDAAGVLARYQGATQPGMNPLQQAKARQAVLGQMSQESQVPPNVLRDYMGAYVLQRDLPALPVPNLGIEELRADYYTPRKEDGTPYDPLTDSPTHFRLAQREVLNEYAQKWGVAPEQLGQWLNTRARLPDENTPLTVSRARGADLASRLHDAAQFPQYVGADGQALGDEHQWAIWDQELARATTGPRGQKRPLAAAGAYYRQLDQARRRGEVRRLQAEYADPAAADYQRWYGQGARMLGAEWEKYATGESPRYKTGTLQDWLHWDGMLRVYQALPAGREKAALRPQVVRLQRQLTPGWAKQWQADQAGLLADEEA